MTTRNTSGMSCARPYRTLRDGSFEGRFPRHFVPGYGQPVPPGQKRFAIEGSRNYLSAYGLVPGASEAAKRVKRDALRTSFLIVMAVKSQ